MDEPTDLDAPANGAAFFGGEVRTWRMHAGLTQKDLGERTSYGRSYVAMVEKGERLGSPEFADSCDRLFATPGLFGRLRKRASERAYPDWFVPYVQLESKAASILCFSASLITGMLQTPEYAHAVFRAAHPREDPQATDERVAGRLQRHLVMERETPPLLWVVLDESCLWRTVGDRGVMVGQLAHLLAQAESLDITLQVLPFGTGAPASHLPFIVLEFADAPSILYVESPFDGQLIDSPAQVAAGRMSYDRLRADALSPEASLVMIRKAMEELRP